MTTRTTCPDDHKHADTTTCYVDHKCGCRPCTTANSQRTAYRRRMLADGRADAFEIRIDSPTVTRRLQALAAIGWSGKRLAERLGMDYHHVLRLMFARYPRVNFSTYERVAALYAELCDRPAPLVTTSDRISAQQALGHAHRGGWRTPAEWHDIDLDETPTDEPAPVDEIAARRAADITPTGPSRLDQYFAAMAAVAAFAAADPTAPRIDAAAAASAELRARITNPAAFALADDLVEAELLRHQAEATTQPETYEERVAA